MLTPDDERFEDETFPDVHSKRRRLYAYQHSRPGSRPDGRHDNRMDVAQDDMSDLRMVYHALCRELYTKFGEINELLNRINKLIF